MHGAGWAALRWLRDSAQQDPAGRRSAVDDWGRAVRAPFPRLAGRQQGFAPITASVPASRAIIVSYISKTWYLVADSRQLLSVAASYMCRIVNHFGFTTQRALASFLHSTPRRISPRGSRQALGRAALAALWRTRCRHSSHPHCLACNCQSTLSRRHFSPLQQQRLHWVWVWAFRLVPLKCAPYHIFLCTPVFVLALKEERTLLLALIGYQSICVSVYARVRMIEENNSGPIIVRTCFSNSWFML